MTAIVSSLGLLVLGCVLLCQSIGSDGNAQNVLDHRYKKSCEGPNKRIILDCTYMSKIKVNSTCYGGSAQHVCTPNVHSCYRHNAEDEYFYDIKEKVATQCDGQWQCHFPVSRHFLGDPPYSQYRTFLEVKYDCVAFVPNNNQEQYRAYACEGNYLSMECRPLSKKSVHIRHAIYGRSSNNWCDPQVLSINKSSNLCDNDVTDILRTLYAENSDSFIHVTSDKFNVPNSCEGVYNYLEVLYFCV